MKKHTYVSHYHCNDCWRCYVRKLRPAQAVVIRIARLMAFHEAKGWKAHQENGTKIRPILSAAEWAEANYASYINEAHRWVADNAPADLRERE